MRVLVTGATGLIGANVCRLLRERGDEVQALVRPGSDDAVLSALGVEIAAGDITAASDVARAAQGTQAVVNSAALLGGVEQDMDAQIAVNHLGSLYCYDAARDVGARMIELTTTPFLRPDQPLTEHPEMRPESEILDNPYALTKGRAFRDGRERAAGGEDIVFVIPGGTFGPSPVVQRSLAPTSYNALVRGAIRGRISEYAAFPVPWVDASDVASVVVSSIDKGVAGAAYLAFGGDEPMTTAAFLSLACEVAGVPHRVTDVVIEEGDEAARLKYGDTLYELATRGSAARRYDNTETRRTLGYDPSPVRPVLQRTAAWLRDNGKI
jgi:dihydroflavonol-4-reductase